MDTTETRLAEALVDRLERELGAGGMATVCWSAARGGSWRSQHASRLVVRQDGEHCPVIRRPDTHWPPSTAAEMS
jgi:hypothetical protein